MIQSCSFCDIYRHLTFHYHPRTLEWRYNLGFVDLDLEFGDKTLSFTVSPVQATVISMFDEKERLSADVISGDYFC